MLGAVMVGRANQYLVRNQNQLMESMDYDTTPAGRKSCKYYRIATTCSYLTNNKPEG